MEITPVLLAILLVHHVSGECTKSSGILRCDDADLEDVVLHLDGTLHTIHLHDVDIDLLDPSTFANASNIRALWLVHCDIDEISAFDTNRSETLNARLRTVSLRDNELETYYSTMARLTQWWPSVIDVDLSQNDLSDAHEEEDRNSTLFLSTTLKVLSLNLSMCYLPSIPWLPANLVTVDLSQNNLYTIAPLSEGSLQFANLSHNHLTSIGTLRGAPRLQSLDVSHNSLTEEPTSPPSSLNYIDMSHNLIVHVDMTTWSGRAMRHVDVSSNPTLSVVHGTIGRQVEFVSLADGQLSTLPRAFLHSVSSSAHVNISGNSFWCDCQSQWLSSLTELSSSVIVDMNATCVVVDRFARVQETSTVTLGSMLSMGDSDCPAWGSSLANNSVVHYMHDTHAHLNCHTFGDDVTIDWWRLEPREHLARWHGDQGEILANDTTKYSLIPGGQLVIAHFARTDIDTYACVLDGRIVKNIQVKPDLTYWFEHVEVYSVVCGVITCLIAFTLHMIYSTLRRFMMWRIERAERTNRVRNMLEAMEKYRAKQMEQAFAAYSAKTTAIRDNYHDQVEQLWTSYVSQTARIKDYKTAQIDAMSEHWGNIRVNYNSQVIRMREYGRGQMEKIGENYERQMNKIRTFSLEQRLKLARQYHFKHGYLNKLAESLRIEWPTWAPDSTLTEPPNVPLDILQMDGLDMSMRSPEMEMTTLEMNMTSTYHSMEDLEAAVPLTNVEERRNSNRSSTHSDFIESISDDDERSPRV